MSYCMPDEADPWVVRQWRGQHWQEEQHRESADPPADVAVLQQLPVPAGGAVVVVHHDGTDYLRTGGQIVTRLGYWTASHVTKERVRGRAEVAVTRVVGD